MSDVVIKVENLSKQYRLGTVGTGTLSHDLNRWWCRLRGKEDPYLKVTEANIRDRKTEKLKTEKLKGEKLKGEKLKTEKLKTEKLKGNRGETEGTTSGSESQPSDISASQDVSPSTSSGSPVPSDISAFQRFSVSAFSPSSPDYVWALKDINFEVKQGEVLGIIGRNGAGKSTLLKILSRVTAPTEGQVKIKGRIAALLEVGTGMHPELTGRENIYLNGAIMGMTKAETTSKLDEIIDFSGCERYIDTPVKRYSSGMKVRLGFAVAAHLDPEILIVDEVLAVGDAEFQKKCLGKMKDVAGQGRTVLFVSHNMGAIRALCPRALALDSGRMSHDGAVAEVIDAYLGLGAGEQHKQEWPEPGSAPGNDRVRLRGVAIAYPRQDTGAPIYTTTPLEVEYQFWNLRDNRLLNISTHLKTPSGQVVFAVASEQRRLPAGLIQGTLRIPGDFLNDGSFSLDVMVVEDSSPVFQLPAVVSFRVHDERSGGGWFGAYPGAVRPLFLRFQLHPADAVDSGERAEQTSVGG